MARYTDFTVNFTIHPLKEDLTVAEDDAAIIQAVKNLVFTGKYERPFAPTRGAGIPQTLFDNMQADVEFILETRILEAIAADEPRASNVHVNVVAAHDRNAYTATIYLTPINSNRRVQVDAVFKRIR